MCFRAHLEEELRLTTAGEEEKKEMVDILKRVYKSNNDGALPLSLEDGDDDGGYDYDSDDDSCGGVPGEGEGEEEGEEEGSDPFVKCRGEQLLSDRTVDLLAEKLDELGQLNEDDDYSGDEDEDLQLRELEALVPKDELHAFYKAAVSGKLNHLVKERAPWWEESEARELKCGRDGTSLVKVIVIEDDGGDDHEEKEGDDLKPSCSDPPKLPVTPVPSLSQLTKREPSKHLPSHLVDILWAYTTVVRRRNGEGRKELSRAEAAFEMLEYSAVLQSNQIAEKPLDQARSYADVATLLGAGRAAVIAALEDAKHFFKSGSQVSSKRRKRLEMKRLEMKMKFFQSWILQEDAGMEEFMASNLSHAM